jgi:hypothetical protein
MCSNVNRHQRKITRTRQRIAELDAEIAQYQRSPFSENETPK